MAIPVPLSGLPFLDKPSEQSSSATGSAVYPSTSSGTAEEGGGSGTVRRRLREGPFDRPFDKLRERLGGIEKGLTFEKATKNFGFLLTYSYLCHQNGEKNNCYTRNDVRRVLGTR